MQSVANKPIMLSAVMPIVVVLSVVMLNVVALNKRLSLFVDAEKLRFDATDTRYSERRTDLPDDVKNRNLHSLLVRHLGQLRQEGQGPPQDQEQLHSLRTLRMGPIS
jgi:hypothetical protein